MCLDETPGGEEDVSIITETASFLKKNPNFTNLKEKIRAYRFSSKAARLFLTK